MVEVHRAKVMALLIVVDSHSHCFEICGDRRWNADQRLAGRRSFQAPTVMYRMGQCVQFNFKVFDLRKMKTIVEGVLEQREETVINARRKVYRMFKS